MNEENICQAYHQHRPHWPSQSWLRVWAIFAEIDWLTTVSQLAAAERLAETPWTTQQTSLTTQNTVYSGIKNDLTTLQADVKALQDPTLYKSALAQSSASDVATANATTG